MNIYKLESLIRKYEGPKLDFKARLQLETESDKKEFTKDVIAIANSRGGRGYILFGVEDKTKRIIGIEPGDYDEEKIQQIICSRVNPPISIAVDILEYKGKKIAALSIFRSHQQPHQMIQNGAFYIRRGSTTDFARREEIASLFQLNGLYSYESTILRNASMEDFDDELLKSYLINLGVTENPSKEVLEGLKFIGMDEETGEYRPTVGGMLIFGKDPSKYFPHMYIKIFNNEEIKTLYGNIPSLLKDVEEYLSTHLETGYPVYALIQTVTNAIIHRDYTDISRGITVVINEKNIEITNPGALMSENLIYRIDDERNPRRRNPWLYQRMLTFKGPMGSSEQEPGIVMINKAFGKAKFLNLGHQNLFKVILPREISKLK